VAGDASAGTDHGTGSLVMLAGTPVRAARGAVPGCQKSQLDVNGNLQIPTDYRSVYQTILQEWLGDDPAAILPLHPPGYWPVLARQDGGSNLFS